MPRSSATIAAAASAALSLAGCNQSEPAARQPIKVTSADQQALHRLDALNLAIALKRSIYDAGLTCKRVTDAGFVGIYENLEMWAAHCVYDNGSKQDWAIFVGPDGSAQIRDCKDVEAGGMPACQIKQRPSGAFDGR